MTATSLATGKAGSICGTSRRLVALDSKGIIYWAIMGCRHCDIPGTESMRKRLI